MIYGMYLSAQGAEAQSLRHDVIANNLANAGTTAFKRDLALFQSHIPRDVASPEGFTPPGNLEDATGGLSLAGVVTDFRNGALTPTGGDLDVALAGRGFLSVSDGSQTFLTRNGKLSLDAEGRLVTHDGGLAVLDADGEPLVLDRDASAIEIAADGTVSQIASEGKRTTVGQLALVEPRAESDLVKVGHSLYQATGPVLPAEGPVQVRQGYLEASGSEPIQGMLEMIETARAFETNMNMIRYQDEMLGRLLQSIPRR